MPNGSAAFAIIVKTSSGKDVGEGGRLMAFKEALAPSFLGLALVHMWIYCSTHRPALTDDVSGMAVMYLALSAALAEVLLASRGRAAGWRPAGLAADALDAAAALCMAACAVALALPLGLPPVLATAAASALGGLGAAWAYARWCALYARLDIRLSAPLAMATMAAGSVGKAFVDLLPAVPAAAMMACLPFGAFLCARRAGATLDGPRAAEAADAGSLHAAGAPRPAPYYNARTVGSLARIAAGVAVYSLCIGVIQSTLLEATSPSGAQVVFHHGLEVMVALAALAWVGPCRRSLDFCRTWKIIAALIVTALLFEPFIGEEHLGTLLALARTAQTYLIVVLFLALANVARHSTYSPYAVFAAGWLAYALPFAAGKLAGDAMAAGGTPLAFALALISWALVVTMLFVLDESSLGNRLIFADLNDVDDSDSLARRIGAVQQELAREGDPAAEKAGADRAAREGPRDLTAARCAALSREHGLTPREAEVMEQLARGRSKAHIAEGYFISENTVRNHAKHIYAKLGVHNRQELLDLVEAEPGGQGEA